MVDVIACFLTCGYTESGAMQFFLKKINDKYDYRQCLPNKTIKKKGMPKKIDDSINGLTGEALLEKVYEIIEQHKDEYSKYKAILIEDDLEKYGFFDGKYIKISDQIIEAIQTDVKVEIKQLPKVNQDYVDPIVHSRRLHYSKKLHGQRMLKNIRPDKVADKCKHYFNPAYQKLKEF